MYLLRPLQQVKYTATMTYGNWPNRIFGFFCSSFSSSSVELAYRQSGTSTRDGFYTKRLLSVACVILDQQNLRNFTQSCVLEKFPYLLEAIFRTCTCIPRFIERRGSSARVRGVEWGGARANTNTVYMMVKHSTKKQKWTL